MNRLSLRAFAIALAAVALPLLLLFRAGFSPSQILFANDMPFGLLNAQADTASEAFTGHWRHLNWVGRQEIEALPGPTQGLFFALNSPTAFAKWHAPAALLFLGLSAWFYCRRSGFHPAVGPIVGIAAALNSNPFSYACWGLSPKCYALGFIFLALAALQPGSGGWKAWARAILGGFAVGMNVTEGADVGAILSLYVAAAATWDVVSSQSAKPAAKLAGLVRVGVVALAAGWIAAQAVQSLTGFAIKGIQGMEPGTESPQQRWEYITQWSFPKVETLRLAVPGLFGYRMDTPDGGGYWGSVGMTGTPQGRFSGSGEYAGIIVLLVAGWAVARSLSKAPNSPFTEAERRRIWFWAAAALVSLLIAYGRFFPLFRLVFALPFLSTIRLPIKYLHGLHVCVLVLFAHGLEGIARAWLADTGRNLVTDGPIAHLKAWFHRATGFDRTWSRISLFTVGGLAAATLVYALSGSSLQGYLTAAGFKPDDARALVGFSQREAWIALGVLTLGAALVLLAGSRWFSRPGPAFWSLGLLVAVDLFRADVPWVVHYDKDWRYQSNPLVEKLREGAAAHWRMTARLYPPGRDMLSDPRDPLLPAVHNLWLEHHLQFYRIPTLDIIQMPRTPVLDDLYLKAFVPGGRLDPKAIGRLWQLTSTRYLLGAAGLEAQLNEAFAGSSSKFTPVYRFAIQPKPGVPESRLNEPDSYTAVTNPNGPYALYENSAALPRATWIPRWTVLTNTTEALARVVDPAFNPASEVVLAEAPANLTPGAPDARGEAAITRFAPREVEVKTKAGQAGILLLNDRWHEHWHATLDGQPAAVLRANHIMRGVALPPGEHTIVFRYDPPHPALTLSLSAFAAALALMLALVVIPSPKEASAAPKAA